MAHGRYVVILVHGTGATRARWIRRGSIFRSGLSRILTDVEFVPFAWTGANSNEARVQAGIRLVARVLLSVTSYPDSKIFIMAHSHGGNVAAYALRDERLYGKVAGVCCIGTPFIIFERRKVQASIEVLKRVLAILGTLFSLPVLAGAMVFVQDTVQRLSPKLGEVLLFLLFTIFPLWFVTFAIGNLYPRIRDSFGKLSLSWAKRTQLQMMSKFEIPALRDIPVLCVTTKRDEAGRWLSFITFIARVPFRLWNLRAAIGTYFALCVAHFAGLYAMSADGTPMTGEQWFNLVGFSLGYAFLNILALSLFLQFAMAVTARFTQGFVWGFGPSSISASWVVKMSASVMPVPGTNFELKEFTVPARTLKAMELRHSWLHDSDTVAEYVARWCVSRDDKYFLAAEFRRGTQEMAV